MSTDNTAQEEGITIVISHQLSQPITASEVLGTTVGVSEVIKTSAIESIVGSLPEAEKKLLRADLMTAVGNARLGGVAGLGLAVYDDGVVGITSTGVTALAGLGAAGMLLLVQWLPLLDREG